MTKKDVIALWEQEGDLERMKNFFENMDSHAEQKERIKQLALQKLHTEEPIGLGAEPEGFMERVRRGFKSFWWRWQWKMALPAVALILIIFLGQVGMDRIFETPLSRGKATSTESMNQMPSLNTITGEASKKEAAPMSPKANPSFDADVPKNRDVLDTATQYGVNPKSEALGIAPPLPGPQPTAPPADETLPRKITYNMNVNLQVENVDSALERIIEEVKSRGGYVVESQQDFYQNTSNAHATLKIPSNQLEGFRGLLPEVGKVLNQHTTANDITNQYYDTETRLRSWEAQEKRYLEILSEAHTVDDILRIEGALGNIRMQIEQLKGQLKLWDHEVSYSTIQLSLQTTPNPVNINDPWQPVSWSKTWQAAKDAVLKTLSSTWNGLNYVFVGIAYSAPYLLLGVMILGVYKGIKKYKR